MKLGSILGTLININIYFTADHWDTTHQDCKVFGEVKTLELPFDMQAAENGQNWAPRKFTAFGKTFFEVGAIRNNFLFRWVYVLALPDQAEHYFYHATLTKNSRETIRFFGQCRSLVESPDEVIGKEAFSCPVITAKRYLHKF